MENQVQPSQKTNCERLLRKPNNFTHHILEETAFYCNGMQQGLPPDGSLKSETEVLLYSEEGSQAWIITEDGMLVAVLSTSLSKH